MIDLHSHVLSGVDDGAQTMEESLQLLKLAAATGTTDIMATPHVVEENNYLEWQSITSKVKELNELAQVNEISIHIHNGTELQMNWELLKLFKGPQGAYCLANSCYALVELPMNSIPKYADEFWYQLQIKDIKPILAHPERYPKIAKHPKILLQWVQKGVLLQMNTGSLTGKYGQETQEFAELLLKNDLIHFIGSDAHNMEHRNTDCREAIMKMKVLIGEEKTEVIAKQNPQYILDNKYLHIDVPNEINMEVNNESKSFFSKFFK